MGARLAGGGENGDFSAIWRASVDSAPVDGESAGESDANFGGKRASNADSEARGVASAGRRFSSN